MLEFMIARFFTKQNTMKKITVLKSNRELKEEQSIIAQNYITTYSNSDIEEFSLTDYFKNNKGLNTYERTSRLRVAKII